MFLFFLLSLLSAHLASSSFPSVKSFIVSSALISEFSGIVEGLQDDFVRDDDVDGLVPAAIGPAVDDLVVVSTLRADLALATIPLLSDDFT